MVEVRARRVFVVAWILLGLAGALDHTIAEKALGTRFDLLLPHLKYGYVMFNVNPRTVHVYEYTGHDGSRHNIAELAPVPAPGYLRARVAIDVEITPAYLAEICLRANRATHDEYDFLVETYEVDVEKTELAETKVLHCSSHGLRDVAAGG